MDDLERYRRALRRILDHRADGPRNEWSEAAAFHAVQRIAGDALDPGAREARVERMRVKQVADRRLVNVLRRGVRYFYSEQGVAGGAWVRFLKGDGEYLGLVHVEVLENVDIVPIHGWHSGARRVVRAVDLRIGEPGGRIETDGEQD